MSATKPAAKPAATQSDDSAKEAPKRRAIGAVKKDKAAPVCAHSENFLIEVEGEIFQLQAEVAYYSTGGVGLRGVEKAIGFPQKEDGSFDYDDPRMIILTPEERNLFLSPIRALLAPSVMAHYEASRS